MDPKWVRLFVRVRDSKATDGAEHPLSEVATGRTRSLFVDDIHLCGNDLRSSVETRRILCIGGSGSIGFSTLEQLAALSPAVLHIVDQNENSLTEATRVFRAAGLPGGGANTEFRALPLDYGAQVMRQFIQAEGPYDIVLNFAAIKHVRSEKDVYSTLQMFDTNLLKQAQLLKWLSETGFKGRYFSVSTDKAANPTSMMGATKRAMEHVMFSPETGPKFAASVTSARFANVAFSDGSLLKSFEHRLARGEPLAAPRDTSRYFVSLEEAGQLCLIAAASAPTRSIVIPRLDPAIHLVDLAVVAERFLARHGWEARRYGSEFEATSAMHHDRAKGRWPLLLTPLDTSGEKPYEEFVGEEEETFEIGLPNLLALNYRPPAAGGVGELMAEVESLVMRGSRLPTKEALKALLGRLEPSFLATHRETGLSLDDRR
jgi:FlaA1/EpsC-like NDP-sugar epimerase